MQIRVITFNIHHGRGTDQRLDLARIAEVLERSGAELIGLNEVDKHFSARSEYEDQAAWLADKLGMHYVYGPAITRNSGQSSRPRQYGNAFLSRYPILSHRNHPFPKFRGVIEDRALLETLVDVQGIRLKNYVTHLSLNPIFHRVQTSYILRKVIRDQDPVILFGDWNMLRGSRPWKRITAYLKDVSQEFGNSSCLTYPSARPTRQLDYLFVSADFEIQAVEAIRSIWEASDHLPLRATITYRKGTIE